MVSPGLGKSKNHEKSQKARIKTEKSFLLPFSSFYFRPFRLKSFILPRLRVLVAATLPSAQPRPFLSHRVL
jgi:hypothetical protein